MIDKDFIDGRVISDNVFFRDVLFPLAMCQIGFLLLRFIEDDNGLN
jgi:hypothetical protein